MLFQPSQEIHDRLRAELSGVFVDRSLNEPHRWLVAKLPTNVIREIMAGARVSLRVWVVTVDDKLVLTFGMTVFDDSASPMTVFGSCRSDNEATDLRHMLADGAFPIQFFNETCLPLLFWDARIDPSVARDVLALAPSVGYPEAEGRNIREKANDIVQAALAASPDPREGVYCELLLTCAESQAMKIQLVGVGDVQLTNEDEGAEMEVLTLQAFEAVFPFGAFINPWAGDSKNGQELCDVLAVSRIRELDNEGIFVVQNKAASATTKGLGRSTDRRASAITKDILKGIKQVSGAIRALKAGTPIYREQGGIGVEVDPPIPELNGRIEPLELQERAKQIGHGLIVVSEMHSRVDWDKVMNKLAKLCLATEWCCQVLDLKELGRLITHSDGRPAVLEDMLQRRGVEMARQKKPDIRFHFIVEPEVE
jgi:hypothetical protein